MSVEQKLLDMIRMFLPEVPATIHDLKNPTAHFSCQIYTAVLNELGVTNTLKNIQHTQMQVITYSDMFADIIPYINVCKGVNYFMKGIGVEDFGLSDLLYPEPKRNLHLMGKLLQFICYADTMIGRLQSDELIALKIKRYDLLIRIEELKAHINQRVSERARNENLLETQGKSADDLKNQLNEFSAKKENILKEIDDFKKQSVNRMETLKKYEFLETKFADEITTLEGMDEEIPDNIIAKIDQLTNYRDELKKDADNIINQTAEKKHMIAFITDQVECFGKRHNELKFLCDLRKTIYESEMLMDSYSSQLRRLNNQRIEMVREEELISNDINNQHKVMSEFEEYQKQIKQEQEAKLNSLKNKCEEMKINQLEMKTQVQECEVKLRQLTERKKELQNESALYNETVERAFYKIVKSEKHFDTCIETLNKYSANISKMERQAGMKFRLNIFK